MEEKRRNCREEKCKKSQGTKERKITNLDYNVGFSRELLSSNH